MSTLAIVLPKAEYDRRNEAEFRDQVTRTLTQGYDRRSDLTVPFGKTLGFTSAQGQVITFGYNESGQFTIKQDANSPFGLASISYVSSVQTSLEGQIAVLEVDVEAANDAAEAAASSAMSAQTSATNAGNSATAAQTSATNASTSASNAATSATNASNSASNASTSASQASTSASNAAGSASAANISATAAAASEFAAAGSATAASGSASNASSSATQAATSASNAAGSASNASTSATNAANSATSAGNSATAASTSASNASTSATNAGVSASAAQTSATNAAGSASNAASSASTATTQASNASASAASAAASSTLSATFASGSQGSINSSATFADNANATGVPTNWNEWTNGAANTTRVTGIAPQPYAVTIAAPAATNCGILQPLGGRLTTGWHVLEADVTLNSGALTGAGMIVNSDPPAGYTEYQLIFSTDPDINGSVIGAGATGKLYKFRKLVQITAGNTYTQIFAMSHYSGLGSIAAANSITWHRCAVRPASQAEIEARQAKLDLVTANAAISANQAAQATINSAQAATNSSISARVTNTERTARNLFPNPSGNGQFVTAIGTGLWQVTGGTVGNFRQERYDWLGGNVYIDNWASYTAATNRAYYFDVPITNGTYQVFTLSWQGWVASFTGVYVQLYVINTDGSAATSSPAGTLHTGAGFGRASVTTGSSGGGSVSFFRVYVVIPAQTTAGYSAFSISQIKIEAGPAATPFTDDTSINGLNTRTTTNEANITANQTAIANETSARASADNTLTAKIQGGLVALGPSDFSADGLYWYNGFGGDPATRPDPTGGIAYANVANIGRVMQVSSFATYLTQKAVIRPSAGRRYRMTCEVRASTDATGGNLSAGIYLANGLDASWNHGGPNIASYAIAGLNTSETLTVAGGWKTIAVEFALSGSAGTYDAAWRPRLDLNRSAGTGGVIEIRKFLLEDVTDATALQASVTTNASAIATVDGKLTASYGLTVDANGRIASMKLLSNGTTSSVKFTADTFQIFNGSTDVAPFEVTGGNVKIKSANVGTLNIGSGGITIQSGSSGARIVISNSLVEVYDSTRLRVRMGIW